MNTFEVWQHLPQEQEGNYLFSGSFYVTSGVSEKLSAQEISDIYIYTRKLTQEQNLDYLQVFLNLETGEKLFFIDQIDKSMIESGKYLPHDNYCTLMFASEY
ncbi:hypothetical protein H9Q08_16935 [Chryseobacterium sp. PS-8]|uniref:Uncharacterized protein n=1 Tax=Chryseobacterium indicum TaxID=2766954 RepID=A0ABS9C9W0_9FLAO|nr:hypothetical protein [Chryseobacterium sp. PS-8]MCF2220972.1 hypothetical protein [Chryseobacterium sp. PS-8]